MAITIHQDHDIPNLFRSSMPLFIADFDAMQKRGISAIVTLNQESFAMLARKPELAQAMDFKKKNFSQFFVPLPSKGGVPTPQQILLFKNFLDKNLKLGKKVLVHCSRGDGRTGTMLLVYKLLSGKISFEAARRAAILLEFSSQRRFIEEFEKETLPKLKQSLAASSRKAKAVHIARPAKHFPKPHNRKPMH